MREKLSSTRKPSLLGVPISRRQLLVPRSSAANARCPAGRPGWFSWDATWCTMGRGPSGTEDGSLDCSGKGQPGGEMGREALCTCRCGADAGEVKALLETEEVILRGAVK